MFVALTVLAYDFGFQFDLLDDVIYEYLNPVIFLVNEHKFASRLELNGHEVPLVIQLHLVIEQLHTHNQSSPLIFLTLILSLLTSIAK